MEEKLVKVLRTPEVLLIGINGVVGGGIFLLPGQVAKLAGPQSVWAYLIAGVVCILIGLAFAEASSMFSRTGGAYVYTEVAFGKAIGFTVGFMSWLTYVVGWAALSNGFASYLVNLIPALSPDRNLLIVVAIASLCTLNTYGVRNGSFAINVFSIAKLIPLLLLIVIGIFAHHTNTLDTILPGTGDFAKAVLLLIFAYGGFEMATIPTGEMVNPRRTVSIAVIGTLTGVTIFYMLIQYAALRLDPHLATAAAPLDQAGAMMFGGGALIISIGAVLSILGTKSGVALAAPRSLYALAFDRSLPSFLALVHKKYHTPIISIWITGVIVILLAVSGTFSQLILLNVAARLYVYLMVCVSVIALRFKAKERPRGFKLPFGITIPIVASILCLWLLTQEDNRSLALAGSALVIGLFIFFINRAYDSPSKR